jgi:retron-type reverse transcriptase
LHVLEARLFGAGSVGIGIARRASLTPEHILKLRLIRQYLDAGIMAHGVMVERHEGTPQGGPLSPLLANVPLDEIDKELEKRGHAFSRYADVCTLTLPP